MAFDARSIRVRVLLRYRQKGFPFWGVLLSEKSEWNRGRIFSASGSVRKQHLQRRFFCRRQVHGQFWEVTLEYVSTATGRYAIVKEKDPAARSSFEILLTYSGLKSSAQLPRAHWFYQHKFYTIARIISQRARHKTGIEDPSRCADRKGSVHRPRHGRGDRRDHHYR